MNLFQLIGGVLLLAYVIPLAVLGLGSYYLQNIAQIGTRRTAQECFKWAAQWPIRLAEWLRNR